MHREQVFADSKALDVALLWCTRLSSLRGRVGGNLRHIMSQDSASEQLLCAPHLPQCCAARCRTVCGTWDPSLVTLGALVVGILLHKGRLVLF